MDAIAEFTEVSIGGLPISAIPVVRGFTWIISHFSNLKFCKLSFLEYYDF